MDSHLGKLSSSQPVLLSPPPLKGEPVSLPLKHHWGYQPLDLGGLILLLLAILKGQGPLDHVLADIVILAQVEELPDLAGTLGSKSPGDGVVGESGDLTLTLLDDGQVENGEITVNNTAADRLTLALSLKLSWVNRCLTSAAIFTHITSGSVTRLAFAEEESDTLVGQNTLLHGETLLVVSSGDSHNVALELVSEGFSIDLLTHPLLVKGPHL